MTCRCAERRAAILSGVRAIAKGDKATAIEQVKFVGQSSIEDAKIITRSRIAAARAKLARRR